MTPEAAEADRGPLGILACAGALPLEIAERTRSSGRNVHIVGIEGFAAAEIADFPHTWASLGQVGRMLKSLRRAGCRDLVIAGALRRPNLWRLRIDHGFFRSIGTVLRMTRGGDDSVLRLIVRFFEGEGFVVRGIDEVAPELLAADGPMGRMAPEARAEQAMVRAAALVRALGPFDVGQAVIAAPDRIIAVEGARGTDVMLGQLCEVRSVAVPADGAPAVLVKLPKPGQELRIDLPAIGPRTVELSAAAGLAGIAVATRQSLVLERAETMALADRLGLFVAGFDARKDATLPGWREPGPSSESEAIGRRTPAARERRDIDIGGQVLAVLAAHSAGNSVVVAGEHVLGIDATLGIDRLLGGVRRGSHWGLRVFKRRIGVLVLQDAALLGEAASEMSRRVAATARAGLAGIAVSGKPRDRSTSDELARQCNDHGLFLVMVATSATLQKATS